MFATEYPAPLSSDGAAVRHDTPAASAPDSRFTTSPPALSHAAGWQARLRLAFERRGARTVLSHREHLGPLRVQKPLYPEGDAICHTVVIHPPGGIAGGDSLQIEVEVGAAAHAVLTTPGASKWYKSNQRRAQQQIVLRVADGACLDWLPQNNIVFDAAQAELDTRIILAPEASVIGWEATQLGRQVAGERWRSGSLRAGTTLARPDGTLLWTERAVLTADDPLRDGPQGLAGWPAFGTLWACGPSCRDEAARALAERLAAILPYDDQLRAGVSALPNGVLLIRVVAREMETLQRLLIACWQQLRPVLQQVPARPLRIWST